jgi:hypothetical protein
VQPTGGVLGLAFRHSALTVAGVADGTSAERVILG